MSSPTRFEQRDEIIFMEALKLVGAERAGYLESACGGDSVLRSRIEELLKSHEQARGFMNEHSRRPAFTVPPGLTLRPGDRVGRYKLLEQIGEGGCGIVYVAEQEEPVRRRVALKLIKAGMDTQQVVARFEAERQALALMDHPNIAQVLDAGATETGRPYFVMELVRGIKITDYCDDNKLSPAERMNLFTQVCKAIQHAHQKGVVHRDIKPSNILVTVNDSIPVPKVIDFGIAKAIQGRLTEQTVYTAFEQFIGTPAYMSPEQATMTSLDIDTRSDIYSLGVLLYELLTGKTPFDGKELLASGLQAMRDTICEKEPVRPSTRLSTMLQADLSTTARERGLGPPELINLLRGDLDWIVMKCLEKDRTRRYETASSLAEDICRHLNNEPVLAFPPGRAYRLQKLVRRNKLAFVAGAAVLSALLAGGALSAWQAGVARKQRDAATEARKAAEAINEFLAQKVLFQATPEQNPHESKLSLEEAVDRAAAQLSQSPDVIAQPLAEAALRFDFGSTYYRLGKFREAEQELRRSIVLREQKLGPAHRDTLAAKLELAGVLLHGLRQFDEGERLSTEALKQLRPLVLAGDARDARLYRKGLDAVSLYAQALMHQRQLSKALELTEKNAADYERAFGPDDLDAINELQNLGLVCGGMGKYTQAEQRLEEAIQRYKKSGKADDPNALNAVNNLALFLQFQGALEKAERLLRDLQPRARTLLGESNYLTLHIQFRLARILDERGQLAEAASLVTHNLALRRETLSSHHLATGASMLLLGRILVEQARPELLPQAESLLHEAHEVFSQQPAGKSELVALTENWLGAAAALRGDYQAAERLLLKNVDALLTPTGEISPSERRTAVAHLVQLYHLWQKPDQVAKWETKFEELQSGRDSSSAGN